MNTPESLDARGSVRRAVAAGLFVAMLIAGGCGESEDGGSSANGSSGIAGGHPSHRGRAGVYLRLGNAADQEAMRRLVETHPLVDAVVLGIRWRDVEPEKGRFDFAAVRADIDRWAAAGKGVVVVLSLYGQAVDDAYTPSWLYEEPDVRAIWFEGGGASGGAQIRIPVVWDPDFLPSHIEPLVTAFGEEFDGHPGLWYVMPGFGHNGNLVCQPSKDGARASVEAGFTPELWAAYCRGARAAYRAHFPRTALVLKTTGVFLRDRDSDGFAQEASSLLGEFAREGVSVIRYGLDADASAMQELASLVAPVAQEAWQGTARLGLGDDWPLWVPEERRDKAPTLGRDEVWFRAALENAFGGVRGIPELPTTILLCQEPEILASHPDALDYRPEVEDALRAARERLLRVDRAVFGSATD